MIEEHSGTSIFWRPEIAVRPKTKKVFDALACAQLAKVLKKALGGKDDAENCRKAGLEEDYKVRQVISPVESTSFENEMVR